MRYSGKWSTRETLIIKVPILKGLVVRRMTQKSGKDRDCLN
ncbi:hypothetical protein Mpsy_0014 [Methanolobus psychrophilus R15]|nr:hypothetical protein Mpsy_0014 [Methanolobus psychrophilus R15]